MAQPRIKDILDGITKQDFESIKNIKLNYFNNKVSITFYTYDINPFRKIFELTMVADVKDDKSASSYDESVFIKIRDYNHHNLKKRFLKIFKSLGYEND